MESIPSGSLRQLDVGNSLRRSLATAPNPAIENGAPRLSGGGMGGQREPSLPQVSPSVHAVPLTLPFSPSNATNSVIPARLQKLDNNFSMIFRRKYEKLDWRKLAALDLEKLYKTHDLRTLQENLTQLAFFDLDEELRSIDINPQFTKLFQTMQFSLEYLLYVQDHLQRDLDNITSSSTAAINEKDAALQTLNDEVVNLRRLVQCSRDELKRRKRMIIAQQEIINSAAKGSYHKCPLCEKAFIERKYLETHFCRRHPGESLSRTLNGDPPEGRGLNGGQPEDRMYSGGQPESRMSEAGGDKEKMERPERVDVGVDAATAERIRALEAMLAEYQQKPPCPPCPTPPGLSSTALPELTTSPELELCRRQAQDLENLRRSFSEIQNKYGDSEKALSDLRAEWHKMLLARAEERSAPPVSPAPVEFGREKYEREQLDRERERLERDRERIERENLAANEKVERVEREARERSEREQRERGEKEGDEMRKSIVDGFDRRVTALQDDLERKFRNSEDVWKGRFNEIDEDHKRSIRQLELDLQRKSEENEKSHKAEKLRLQMTNDEQEKRIKELESQLTSQRGRGPPPMQVQQIKVHNRNVKANRWGKNMTPRLSNAVDDHPSMIEDLRSELAEALDTKLEEYGIRKGTTGVSDRDRDVVFNRLRTEHNHLQNKIAKYGAARSTIENHIRDRRPAEYSSQELLDEASKIRVRTRTGRQVVGDDKNQRITEITTYNITPARSSDLAVSRADDSLTQTSSAIKRHVTFQDDAHRSQDDPRRSQDDPRRSQDDPPRSVPRPASPLQSEAGSAEDSVQPPDLSLPPPPASDNVKKQDDEPWFTDEDP